MACDLRAPDLNGAVWSPDPPDVDAAERAMLAVAAHEVDEQWFAAWLRDRTVFPAWARARGTLASQMSCHIRATTVRVRDLEALDGTPVLDVKPVLDRNEER